MLTGKYELLLYMQRKQNITAYSYRVVHRCGFIVAFFPLSDCDGKLFHFFRHCVSRKHNVSQRAEECLVKY